MITARRNFRLEILAVLVLLVGTVGVAGRPAVASQPSGAVADGSARIQSALSPPAAQAAGALASSAISTAGCPRTLWRDDETPAVAAATSTSGVEVGVKFRTDRDGYITGIRFYKGSGNTGTHVGRLWSRRGEKLAEVTFTAESGSGWQRADFGSPVRVSSGTTYVASYHAPVGRYSYSYDYFASAGRVRAPLTALKDGADGGNGVYLSGSGFPTSTYRSINYWVDVVYDTTSDDTCPATVWTDNQAPAVPAVSSSSSVELGVKFRADRDGFIQGVRFFKGSGNTGTHVGRLWSATGQKLAEATFVAESNSGWQQAWFSQPVAISAGATYVASYLAPSGHYAWGEYAFASSGVSRGPLTALRDGVDGGNGVYLYGTGGFPSASYHASNYGVDVLFTSTNSLGCPCTVWPPTGDTAVRASTDSRAAELGVRFRAMRNGYVKGVRFLKGTGNTGTHIGRLWSNSGTNLAQATFTGESDNGWQQVLFSTPVAVTAGTTYVASYYAPVGRYAFDSSYFAGANTTRGPLAAMADGLAGGNGVYRYGAGFPSSTYQSTNYWVDVVYDTSAADTVAPTVVAQSPSPGAEAVPIASRVSARFSESVVGSSVAISVLTAAGTTVAGSTSYDGTTRTAVFTPATPLAYLADYQVRVSGARDSAGNVMAPVTWTFTTAIDPTSGPGGPIGVITSTTSPYSSYYAEILRAEGLNAFSVLSLETVTSADLAKLDVAILGDVTLTDERASLLTSWVNNGGRLIAMSPDPKLATLLGLTATATTLSNGYLAVDPATAPGAGITATTMQFHGTADRYTLAGATTVARLYSTATSATSNPAVTINEVGTAGGRAAAFTYDLARSVALTRQGNPAWAAQERDGRSPIRSDDKFFGGSSPDWVDLSKVAVPQADEQQRLLVNLIEHLNVDRKPLPRFWYLPNGHEAVVVATGDDEAPGTSGTEGRFDRYIANSAKGCAVEDWECLRFTSYLWTSVALTDAQARAYHQQGFEVALHTQNGCTDFTPDSLEETYATQLPEWARKYVSLPAPTTGRYHCISYSDWDSQPKTEFRHGIRFDANYYYWPGTWVQDRPGFMTGSGIPMRFTDTTGRMIDVYQGTTQMTDESGQSYPYTPNALLDRALGADGYYGVFVANMHPSNKPTSYEDDQLVASAQNHGVPVVTSRDVLQWLDARGASSFRELNWSANTLTFTVSAARTARGLTAMLPTRGVGGTTLSTLTRDGAPVAVERMTIKGIEYAMFPAAGGSYTATYQTLAATSTVASVSTSTDRTATVSWTSSVPGTAEVAYGTSPTALHRKLLAESTREHTLTLTGLAPATTYYYRVTSKDTRGRGTAWPAQSRLASFTTPPADTRTPAVSGLRVTPLPDSTVRVTWRTDEPSTSSVVYGGTADQLDRSARDTALVTSHVVVLAGLDAERTFHLHVSSSDPAGNEATFPPSGASPARFVTSAAGVVDQTRVAFRTGEASGSMVVAGDGLADLTLSARTGPGGAPSTGAFESRVLDAARTVDWQKAVWEADVPSGARLTVAVRSGDTIDPDGSWSAWTPVSAANAAVGVPARRYLQYRVVMTAGPEDVPTLHWIGFTHDGPLPGADRRAGRTVG